MCVSDCGIFKDGVNKLLLLSVWWALFKCIVKCGRKEIMADLKIRVFKSGETQPETTVTIPGGVLEDVE